MLASALALTSGFQAPASMVAQAPRADLRMAAETQDGWKEETN
jgi:hypothetical protein